MNQLLSESRELLAVPKLPSMICFRVTRFCNARCGFCLAPPDGGKHPPASALKHRIQWLLANGVRTIHFCGGEPTIHHDLPELITFVKSLGGKSKMTSNGMAVSDSLIDILYKCYTAVKISVHGDKPHHNLILGRDAFDRTVDSIKRLVKAKVEISIQSTVVHGKLSTVSFVIDFCLENKIRRVSFLPFIPRGMGDLHRTEYNLTIPERKELTRLISEKRRENLGRLDIRLLDFSASPIYVVEPDGRIILESATEALDRVVYEIDLD
jgi:MoaA/NifB/PqqE/SkfB family radical SAM enzyme